MNSNMRTFNVGIHFLNIERIIYIYKYTIILTHKNKKIKIYEFFPLMANGYVIVMALFIIFPINIRFIN